MKSPKYLLILVVSCIFQLQQATSQHLKWVNSFGTGPSSSFPIHGIANDGHDNIFMVGSFSGVHDFDKDTGVYNLHANTGKNIAFVKYDKNGNLVTAMNGLGPNGMYGARFEHLLFDTLGNLYVAGILYDSCDFDTDTAISFSLINPQGYGYPEVFIAKYDSSFNLIWAKQIATVGAIEARDFVIDYSGNILLSGYFEWKTDFDPSPLPADTFYFDGGFDPKAFFLKYDSNGNFVMAKSLDGSVVNSLAIDENNNIFITGGFGGTVDFDPSLSGVDTLVTPPSSLGNSNIFIAKYDSIGNYEWAKNIGDTMIEQGVFVEVNSLGELIVVGEFQNDTVDFDPGSGTVNLTDGGIFIASYDTGGNYIWANSIKTYYPLAMRLDAYDDIVLRGFLSGPCDFDPSPAVANLNSNLGSQDMFTARYDQNGNYLDAFITGGPTDNDIAYYKSNFCIVEGDQLVIAGPYRGTADFDPTSNTYNLTSIASIGPNTFDSYLAKYCFNPAGDVGFINGQGIVCQDQLNVPYFIIAVDNAESYVWNYTGSGVTINGTDSLVYLDFSSAATSGILIVYATNDCSDGAVSDSFNITVMPLSAPSASITVNGPTQFCEGGFTTLEANISQPGLTFQWYKDGVELLNDTSSSVEVDTTGFYTVTVTASNGCPQTPMPVLIIVYPLPTPIITQINDTLYSNYTSGNQWYLNGTILFGENDPSLMVSSSGNYTVIVTDGNSCSDTSAVYTYISINEAFSSIVFKAYPNPTTGIFTLEHQTIQSSLQISITDMYGRNVYENVIPREKKKHQINLSDLSNGIYIISVKGETINANQRIVIQR